MNKKTRTRKEEVAYRKKLARVRAYSRDRAEWQKLMKLGNTTYPTLKDFRASKYGEIKARSTEKEIKEITVPLSSDIEGKLERLLNRLRENRKQAETELRSLLG